MNRRIKKKNRTHTVGQIPQPKTPAGPSARELLFHPMIYRSSARDIVEFDCLIIPFLIKENRIYTMSFMDSFNPLSAHIECRETDPDQPMETYRDAASLMKECLEVEQLTGTEYYFGHLDKSVNRYLYALQLFMDKGLLAAAHAMELVDSLGIPTKLETPFVDSLRMQTKEGSHEA